MGTELIRARHAQIVAERAAAIRRYQQQTVLIDGRLAQLRAALAELEQTRTDAQTC